MDDTLKPPHATSRPPIVIAWFASVVSVLLAVAPALSGDTSYRPDLAVLTATLVSLIWYTAFTFQALAHARSRDALERSTNRRAFATAALAELSWIEPTLIAVSKNGPRHARSDALAAPALERALNMSGVFEVEAVEQLAHFHVLLRRADSALSDWLSVGLPFSIARPQPT